MRRSAVSVITVLAGLAAVHAASIERVQIIRAGLWTSADAQLAFSRVADVVPGKLGTIFGIEWRPLGKTGSGSASLKIRWLYPPPGLQHPITRARRSMDEFDYPVTPGGREVTVIELNSDAMILPGKWSVEIADAERVLARQEFTVEK